MKNSKAAQAMKLAWKIFNEAGVRTMTAWSAALRQAWAIVKGAIKMTFTFQFEASNDPRKGVPYAAKLVFDENGKLKREFFNLGRSWGKKNVLVFGEFKAQAGDIIEQRLGGSWKNDYRYWYVVTNDGDLKQVARIDSAEEKAQVIDYLRGKIGLNELIFG